MNKVVSKMWHLSVLYLVSQTFFLFIVSMGARNITAQSCWDVVLPVIVHIVLLLGATSVFSFSFCVYCRLLSHGLTVLQDLMCLSVYAMCWCECSLLLTFVSLNTSCWSSCTMIKKSDMVCFIMPVKKVSRLASGKKKKITKTLR